MENIKSMELPTIEQVKPWIDLLAKPTGGVLAFIVLILYRDTVGHIIKGLFDTIWSWLKRK